jgi:hypothetical protein
MEKDPAQRNDHVFQLSLTELAFTVIFLLLLLTGLIVAKTERERDAARADTSRALDELAYVETKEAAVQALWTRIRLAMIQGGSADPDAVLSELMRRVDAQARADGLRARIDDLNRRLSALEEVRAVLERAAPTERGRSARELVEAGLAALQGIESVTGGRLRKGAEFHAAAQLATDAKRAAALAAENAALEAQGEPGRPVTAGETKGFGLPPCWVDRSGRAQRIVEVTVSDAGLSVKPAWPIERAGEAAAIPGVARLLADERPLDLVAFRERARPVYEWSRRQAPECRHYASIIVAARTVEAAVRGKNLVYEMFYPAGQEVLASDRR